MTITSITQGQDFQRLIQDLDAEAKVNGKGEGTLSIRGTARFLCIKRVTLQNHFTRIQKSPSKMIKRLQRAGFAPDSFARNGIPDKALGIIANYFSTNSVETQERADFLASMGARAFLRKIKGWEEPTFEQPNPFANVGYAIEAILQPLKMKPQLQAGIRAEAIAAQCPELRPAIEAAKKHLLLETKSELLSPTDLGKCFDPPISARKINKILIESGLQEKTENRGCPYIPIGRGLDHSELVADTARGHAKTVQKLRWYDTVLELIKTQE